MDREVLANILNLADQFYVGPVKLFTFTVTVRENSVHFQADFNKVGVQNDSPTVD